MLNKIFSCSRENTVGKYVINTKKGSKLTGTATTEKREVIQDDFRFHIEGKVGLGLSPIMQNNHCMWAALDVDVYPFDIIAFSKKFSSLPIFPCLTKSCGLHIYFFFRRQKESSKIRQSLNEIAYLLGFTDFEIFPKQENITEDKQANWINLPYFNTNERCCYINGEKQTLDQFYELIKKNKIDSFKKDLLNKFQFSGAPDCILKLQAIDIMPGYRDIALLNIGVFLKNKFEDWEDRLVKYNDLLTNPLTLNELTSNIINQLNKKNLFYQCNTELQDYCINKDFCKVKKGILDKIEFGNKIIKLETKPAVWKIELNKQLIKFNSVDLLDFKKFRLIVFEHLNIILPMIKNDKWEKLIKEKLKDLEIEDAPDDASIDSDFFYTLKAFCLRMSNARSFDDVLNGQVYLYKNKNYFQGNAMKDYLRKKGLSLYKGNLSYQLIKDIGGGKIQKRIGKSVRQLWYCPAYEEQIEEKKDYNIPDFSNYDKEEF